MSQAGFSGPRRPVPCATSSSWYGTPNFPLAIAALSSDAKVYVASECDGAVYDLNTTHPASPTLTGSIATGANPSGLLLNGSQSLLYVSNAGSDTVSVVDTLTDTVLETVSVRPASQKNHLRGQHCSLNPRVPISHSDVRQVQLRQPLFGVDPRIQ